MAVRTSYLFLLLLLLGIAQGQISSFSALPQQQDFGARTQRQSFSQQPQSSGRTNQQSAFSANSYQQQPKPSSESFGQQLPKSSFSFSQQQPQQQRTSSNFGSVGQQPQSSGRAFQQSAFSANSYQQQPKSSLESFGQQLPKSSFGSSQQQPQQQRTSSNFGSFGQQQQKSRFGAVGESQQKSSFGSFNQQQPQAKPTGSCPDKNARYPKSSQCDAYIECLDGVYDEKLCPDGLLFDPDVTFNVYPCQYPADVDCAGRGSTQPAQPTENCPHQFGYYRASESPSDCGAFVSCVDGRAFNFDCPAHLAWNPRTYRCEWPDEVEECDAEAFLGLRCPQVPISRELGPPAGFLFYKSDRNCQEFFICLNDKPRLLQCDSQQAFNDETSSCEDLENIARCPQELRSQVAATRNAKKSKF